MKQVFILLVLALIAVIPCRGQMNAEESTESLVQACEMAVRFPTLEAVKKAPAVEQAQDAFLAARCLGYFAGMLDLNSIYAGGLQTYFCPPKDFPKIEAVKIFLKYAKDHPNFMKEEARSIALSALADVLQCVR